MRDRAALAGDAATPPRPSRMAEARRGRRVSTRMVVPSREKITFRGIAAVVLGLGLWFFPLFHVVPLDQPAIGASGAAFAPAAFVEKFWREKLQPATGKAAELAPILAAVRRDPGAAAKQHGHQVGLGSTVYYFVRGAGRVVSVDRNRVVIAVDGTEGAQVALTIGPLFGNTARDGSGLLDVNQFPGLQEFNALSAELNRTIEETVFPAVRERAVVGAEITFAGCAEAPESLPSGPLLEIVPLAIGGTK